MRIVFCDDDPAIRLQLQNAVEEYFQINQLPPPDCASYADGDTLLERETAKADIAFLDVEMPGSSGIHVGAKLMERNPRLKVLIVTSYSDYLDEAMRFHVFRYLSKPINKNRLFANMKDALYQYHLETTDIPLETKNGVTVYTADEILCIEKEQHKTIVHTVYGAIDSVHSMQQWQHLLEYPCFYQTYRSYIINIKHVISFDKSAIRLRYKDMELTPYLARRKYTEFKSRFMLYKESMR